MLGVIVYLILDCISVSKRELTGKVVDKDEETNITMTPIIIGKSTTFTYSSSESYSLYVKTRDGSIYEVECDEEEYEAAKNNDTVVFIEDEKQSGSVYYYTK